MKTSVFVPIFHCLFTKSSHIMNILYLLLYVVILTPVMMYNNFLFQILAAYFTAYHLVAAQLVHQHAIYISGF